MPPPLINQVAGLKDDGCCARRHFPGGEHLKKHAKKEI
jgi:hypothetical protein